MRKGVAKAFSYIFLPHANLILLLILYILFIGSEKPLLSALGAIVFYVIVPAKFLIKYFEAVDKMSGRERAKVIAVGSIPYFLAPVFFYAIGDTKMLALALFLVIFIAVFWALTPLVRPSFHVGSFTAAFTFLGLLDNKFLPFLTLAPIIAWSRVEVEAHTKLQVILGGILGPAVGIIAYTLLRGIVWT